MTGRVRFTDHVIEKGLDLFAALEAKQLEGMVAKRADSLYVSGRSKDWLKVKTRVGIEQMQRRIESWAIGISDCFTFCANLTRYIHPLVAWLKRSVLRFP